MSRRGAWSRATLMDGSAASLASTLVVVACGYLRGHRGAAGTNASSHWVWGEQARHREAPSWRYTALGYAIHHASSLFWAGIYHAGRGSGRHPLARAAGISALACLVDYKVVPKRLTPGFERHLSSSAMWAVYAAFAAGLAARACWRRRRQHRPMTHRDES
ncbi:MAG: hypothetical protein J0H15_07265 [Xanthomonadales bacterium]|nr:hypothetical protein [Xanthomonadales bacterium]